MVSTTRTVDPLSPAETGVLNGLAHTLWLPPVTRTRPPPRPAGVVVLHGADSCKESHHDFARAAAGAGLAAIVFDQRGHGDSDGAMGASAIDDVVTMAVRLRQAIGDPAAPVALRGSSMGGWLALVAAGPAQAVAVVAVCPASAAGLARGVRAGAFAFAVDAPAFLTLLESHDLGDAVRTSAAPLLLMHAEGDERVPVAHSRELAALATAPGSRLIVVPGGHHRSVQHDEELQAVSLRFIARAAGA
jgi:pimeloyl-ACP methyl ester carboxylesterase